MSQLSDGGSSATISWDPLPQFAAFQPCRDATAISLQSGRFLVLGGQKEDLTATGKVQVLEWNMRRIFPWPALQQSRFGAAAVSFNDETLWIMGGANNDGCVLSTVEGFPLPRSENPEWKWSTSQCELPTARLYAAAVTLLGSRCILLVGGRNGSWEELNTVEMGVIEDDTIAYWETLPKPMPAPRMGCAAILANERSLVVLGGYDGRSWRRTCYVYEFSSGNVTEGNWSELPDMIETVRFVQAVRYYKYILVVGERDESSISKVKPTISIQCYDTQTREWIWAKQCVCPSFDIVTLHGTQLYGFTASSAAAAKTTSDDDSNEPPSPVFCCDLSRLDSQLVSSVTPVAIGTEAPEDYEAPTIFAADAVLVAEDMMITMSSSHFGKMPSEDLLAAQPYAPEGPIKLRHVVKIRLTEQSFYTGQLRKKDDSYVPHGQGLLVWIEDEKPRSMESSTHSGSSPSSYYKGQFLNGFRHGLGEMYLQNEDKHYFGAFEYGSWEGMGSLRIRTRGFSYFGQFVSGEMTGHGRCSFRVKQGDQWKQKSYSGGFQRGLAHGRGVISDYMSGRIEIDRDFHEEDLFGLGALAGKSADPSTPQLAHNNNNSNVEM